MTTAQVNRYFQDYAAAFSRSDVDEVCRLWAYPAFFAYEGRQATLDPAAFRQNTIALCAFYARQGLARAEKTVLDLANLTATTATARTHDRLLDHKGDLIAEWEHVYLLTETADGIRAAAAFPDNELAAWRSLGTTLGAR